ncbi:hypothetical protein [Viridibacillus soli]|nr:hypothetical protein [Viridibacillus soli]
MATIEAGLVAFEARVAYMQEKLNEFKQEQPTIQPQIIEYKQAI